MEYLFNKIVQQFQSMTSERREENFVQISDNNSTSFDSNPSSIDYLSPVKLRPLPLFGNLFDLGPYPHRNLARLSSVYGDIIHLQLGKWKAVVLNGSEACKEALIRSGRSTASRPDFESYLHYSHGKSLSFQPYNGIWQIQRKTTIRIISKLINSGVVSKLALNQANKLIETWTKKENSFDPASDVAKTVGEFMYSFCYGEDEHLLENEEFADILLRPNPGTDLFAAGNNIDLLPRFLRFILIGKQKDHIHRMNEFVRLNNLMKAKINDKLIKEESDDKQNCDDESFSEKDSAEDGLRCVMQGMIEEVHKLFKDGEDEIEIDDTITLGKSILHRNCLLNLPSEFLSAGSETSTATLLWVIRYLTSRLDIQEKIFSELDKYVKLKKLNDSNKNTIDHTDRIHLPYTEASFIESLRLMAVVPFGLPHFTTENIQLSGKTIPKNTLILPNLWSAGRDSRYWEEPDTYRPERHFIQCPMKTESEINSLHEQITSTTISKLENCFPFGLGRRRCVGEPVGKMVNFIIFANLMLRFKIQFIEKESIPPTESSIAFIFGKLLKNIADFLLKYIHPNLTSSKIVDKNIMESFGDVMKPEAFKIILTRR